MMSSLAVFAYFQMLDVLTTVVFLLHGVKEANPLVKFALVAAPTPLVGLLIVKGAAVALGIFCCLRGREKLLTRMNIFFALLVSWNLVALIASFA
jgi:Domain of unknown function (DUF5658)